MVQFTSIIVDIGLIRIPTYFMSEYPQKLKGIFGDRIVGNLWILQIISNKGFR